MPLQKQTVAAGLFGGLDSKTDKFQLPPSKMSVLENVTFQMPGRYTKRNGYKALSRSVAGQATQLTNGQALALFRSELLAADPTTLYSYDSGNQTWIKKGPFVSPNVRLSQIVRNSYGQTVPDSARHLESGLAATFFVDSSDGGVHYSITDTATAQTVVADTLVSTTGAKPKVVVLNNVFVFWWYDTNTTLLMAATLPVGSPTRALTPVAITSALGDTNSVSTDNPIYDVTIVGSGGSALLYLAFNNDATGTSLWSFVATRPTVVSVKVHWTDASIALTVFSDASANVPVVAYWTGAGVVEARSYSTLGALLWAVPIETVSNVVNITGTATSTTKTALSIFYTISAAATYNWLIRTATISTSNLLGGALGYSVMRVPWSLVPAPSLPSVLLRSVGLASKAWTYAGVAYVTVAMNSTLQNTYWISNGSGSLVAKWLPGNGGAFPNAGNLLPEVSAASTTAFWIPSLQKDLLTTLPSTTSTLAGAQTIVYTQTGVSAVTVDFFDEQDSYLRAELGQNLHFGGGFVQMYDGLAPVEHGFHVYPENIVATQPVGGVVDVGVHWYCVIYQWTDNEGQVHQSAPSIPQSITADGSHKVQLVIPTLRLTAKHAPLRAPATVLVFRTLAAQTTFFQATSTVVPAASSATNAPVINDTTVDTVTFIDNLTDAQITGNPTLYTTGGAFENIEPGPMSSLTVYQNRIVGLTGPLEASYSKQVTAGQPVQFSDSFTLDIDPIGGDCTAVAGMDDKLIFFKESRVYYMSGVGPDATGNQNDFQGPFLVTTDCGCISPRSIVTVPDGLMFQSAKGIYLLGRDLSRVYIGADVEEFNSDMVTSAQLIPTANQVRFTLASGTVLVYDYYVKQWATWTGIKAVDSVIFDDTFVWLRADATAMQEDATLYTDDGSFVSMKMTTGWLKFAGLQGWQRTYQFLVLGEYFSPHQLVISIAYNTNLAPQEQYIITPAPTGTYGDDTYGNDSPYGGPFPEYQWRVFPAQPKNGMVQITIQDAQNGTPGQSMALSALTFVVGIEPGATRRPAVGSV